MLVLRVGRCERRTSLTVNADCWHALPMGVHATLMLAPGCSPWRPKSEPTTSPDAPSRTVAAGPTCGARVTAFVLDGSLIILHGQESRAGLVILYPQDQGRTHQDRLRCHRGE